MAWEDIFTKTIDNVVITACRLEEKGKPTLYTYRFEARKRDEKGTYLSPNIPEEGLGPETLSTLHLHAAVAIATERQKEDVLEETRVKLLSAKPGSHIKTKEKGAPRSTGKTAKKKAKLEAARKQPSA